MILVINGEAWWWHWRIYSMIIPHPMASYKLPKAQLQYINKQKTSITTVQLYWASLARSGKHSAKVRVGCLFSWCPFNWESLWDAINSVYLSTSPQKHTRQIIHTTFGALAPVRAAFPAWPPPPWGFEASFSCLARAACFFWTFEPLPIYPIIPSLLSLTIATNYSTLVKELWMTKEMFHLLSCDDWVKRLVLPIITRFRITCSTPFSNIRWSDCRNRCRYTQIQWTSESFPIFRITSSKPFCIASIVNNKHHYIYKYMKKNQLSRICLIFSLKGSTLLKK